MKSFYRSMIHCAMRLAPVRWLGYLWVALLPLMFIHQAWALNFTQSNAADTAQSPHVRAQLLAYAPQGVQTGQPLWVGIALTHTPGWHTYWKNAGDSGLPTTLTWTLPNGVQAGDVAWPVPKKFPVAHLVNYGYDGMVLLPVPLTIDKGFQPQGASLALAVQVDYLVCQIECIPESVQLALDVPLTSSVTTTVADFEAVLNALPKPLPSAKARVAPPTTADGNLQITVQGLPKAWQGKPVQLFVADKELVQTAATLDAALVQKWQGGAWTANLPLSPLRHTAPAQVELLLIGADATAHRVQATVQGAWPPMPNPADVVVKTPANDSTHDAANNAANVPSMASSPSLASPAQAPTAPAPTLWLILLGAFAGGLLLNLMPCVLPVLAIKVLHLLQNVRPTRSARLGAALAYLLGVVLTFVSLAILLLVLKQFGAQVGWGFQLQSPWVVAGLMALFIVIGLQLLGVIRLSVVLPERWLQGAAAEVTSANNQAGFAWSHFASGVLTVIVASPCTAPFMGASLGAALTLPALPTLLVFVLLGLGMALPFVLLALYPNLLAWLPKPGRWMLHLQRLLAVPMLLTAAWLAWVLYLQIAPMEENSSKSIATNTQDTSASWQIWSPERVQAATSAGQAVLIDFTAAWCVTCQVNKRSTLNQPDVMAQLAAQNVLLLRADWTRPDPRIAKALQDLGRSGLPTYAFYPANGGAVRLLPEVLTPAVLLAEVTRH